MWPPALIRRIAVCVFALTSLLSPAQAQDRASLIADSLQITGDNRLIASGAVEIFYQGRRLRATGLVYDQAADRLEISGPLVLTDTDGSAIILASQAEMAADLSEGVLKSARMVLNQQLQLASDQMLRVGGRYTQLGRSVASSCKICADNPTPLWEIRARRIVHDQLERQIYFDHAQLRFGGVPVFYIPRLRMPDPSLTRTSGFLMPSLRTTSGLGTGIKVPYFLTLGPSRDLTLTPYLSTKSGRTLEFRFREALNTGDLEFEGAISRDELLPDDLRGYLFIRGAFDLAQGYKLTIKTQAVTDNAYLLDYGVSDADRLDSRVEIARTRRNEHISGRVISFQTLRDGEDNATIPSVITDLTFHRRFSLGALGGEGGLRLQTHSQWRTSDAVLDGADDDSIADGRDTSRLSLRLDWRRSWILPLGIEGTLLGEVTADAYNIRQDASFAGRTSRTHSAAGVELRWPWVATAASGANHVIEPVVQLIWAEGGTETLPNEDSTLVEFDEGNMYSLNRFPGSDAVERGARANVGIGWTRYDPAGWSLGVTVGRVFRTSDPAQFGVASGLDGKTSDWLAGAQISLSNGTLLTTRAIFDDAFTFSKAEARLDLNREKLDLSTGYVFAVADPLENRPDPIREVTLAAQYKITPNWTGKAAGRYNFVDQSGTTAALGVEFRNECMRVDLSLSRRFTSSTTVKPTTDFGLSVDLIGFGSGVVAGPARTCRR